MEDLKLDKKTQLSNITTQLGVLKNKRKEIEKQLQTESDEAVKELRVKKLEEVNCQITELEEELEKLSEQNKKALTGTIADLISNTGVADPLEHLHMAYIASDNRYLIINNTSEDPKQVNIQEKTLETTKIIGTLNALTGRAAHFDEIGDKGVRQAFEWAGASYYMQTSSFDAKKWKKTQVFNTLEVQRKFWAPTDIGIEYNELFDDLIYCLGGGKQENIDHLEQWVAYKYLHPEKVTITPGINLTGIPGGNGKGMFTVLLTSIFTGMGVSLIRSKNLTGGFNAIMKGKVIGVLDDEKKEDFPHTELKQTAGNGSQVIEPKGVDAYTVDATANIIVFDNGGLVKLVGGGSGGEDRRWSILFTEIVLLEHLQQKYGCSYSEAQELADGLGGIIADRRECGKWLAAVIERHNMRQVALLKALHGHDYRQRLNDQRDQWVNVFESILPVLKEQGLIPFKFIKEIIEAVTGKSVTKPADLSTRFDEFLSRNGYKGVEKESSANIRVTYPGMPDPVKFKGALRRIRPDARDFDYSRISNSAYTKKSVLTLETLQIHDYDDTQEISENQEKTSDSADQQIYPANPATPLKPEKTALQTPTEQGQVSGVKTANPANPAKTPAVFMENAEDMHPKRSILDMMAELKEKRD